MKFPCSSRIAACGGFSLVEMLLVVALMAIMLALAVPAVNTISNPRRASIEALKTRLEHARSLAMRERSFVFVAFTDGTPEKVANQYRRYSLFKLDPEDPNPDLLQRRVVQEGTWEELGEGLLFAHGADFEVSLEEPFGTIHDLPLLRVFPTFLEPEDPGGEFQKPEPGFWVLPFFLFNPEGKLEYPSVFQTEFYHVGLIEGFIAGGERRYTRTRPGIELDEEFPQAECLHVAPYSGRIRIISD